MSPIIARLAIGLSYNKRTRRLKFWSRKVVEQVQNHVLKVNSTPQIQLRSKSFISEMDQSFRQFENKVSNNLKMDQDCNLTREFLIACQISFLIHSLTVPVNNFGPYRRERKRAKVAFSK